MHTAAATIPIILPPAIGYAIWLLSALTVPLVAWARVRLGAHDWKQATAGAAAALGLVLIPP